VKTDLFRPASPVSNTAIYYNDFQGRPAGAVELPAIRRARALRVAAKRRRCEGLRRGSRTHRHAGRRVCSSNLSGSYEHWDWKCVNPEVVGLPFGPCSGSSAVINRTVPDPDRIHEGAGARRAFSMNSRWAGRAQLDAALRCDLLRSLGRQRSRACAGLAVSPLWKRTRFYTVSNAHLTWRNAKKDLQATLEVTNLTNKYYYYSKFDLTGGRCGHHHRLARSPARVGTGR